MAVWQRQTELLRSQIATGALSVDVVVVTGAASGLGRWLTEYHLQRGDHVVAGDIDFAGLSTLSDSHKDRLECVRCDTTSLVDLRNLVASAKRRFGKMTVWYNNAGIRGHGEFASMDSSAVALTLQVNIQGVLQGTSVALQYFEEQGYGRIVNIGSVMGVVKVPFASTYAASKHAVVGFTRSLQKELAVKGSPVKLQLVCPGFFNTAIIGCDDDFSYPSHLRFLVADLERTGQQIVRGIFKNKTVVYPTWNGRLILAVNRLSSGLITWLAPLTHKKYCSRLVSRIIRPRSIGNKPLDGEVGRTFREFWPRIGLAENYGSTPWRSLRGRFPAWCVETTFDRELVRSWLPDSLEPAVESSTIPVIMIFGQQQDVRQCIGRFALRLPFGVRYGELMIVIPDLYVRSKPSAGRVCFIPRLYVGNRQAVRYGRWLYDFNKIPAEIESSRNFYRVYSRHKDRELIRARFTEVPDTKPVNFGQYFKQPLAFPGANKTMLKALHFDAKDDHVTTSTCEITIREGFLPGITDEMKISANAFFMDDPWLLKPAIPARSLIKETEMALKESEVYAK